MSLTEPEIQHLITQIKDYQITHGSLLKLVRVEEPSTVPAKPVGVSILPTKFPRKRFDEAVALQTAFNKLYVTATNDAFWLSCQFEHLLQRDAFLSALWNIHLQVDKADAVQSIVCGVFRSDYMLQETDEGNALKQVEMNTFSVAGACHAERVAGMHRHMHRVRDAGQYPRADTGLLESSNTAGIVKLLKTADKCYIGNGLRPTCILMIVQPHNFNIADERPIEYGVWDNGIPCYRCEWQAVINQTILTSNRTLLFRPYATSTTWFEVSVIYYRAGYEAEEYDQLGTRVRLHLETSRSIKCPDVLTHLTTFKAVQHALAKFGAAETFLRGEDASSLPATFMEMHGFNEHYARQLATDEATAKDYVLKPNLEGGGHNIYGSDIPAFVSQLHEDEWSSYILMKMIRPPQVDGLLMMPSQVYSGPVVSELGILGTCIWRRNDGELKILSNKVAGWTFKTKPASVDEMSVVKGYGCFDCPELTDD